MAAHFLGDVANSILFADGRWNPDSCDHIWLIGSVNTFDDHPGRPVFLGRREDGYCWFYEFEDEIYAIPSLPDAKAELALADSSTSIPLFLVGLGDLLRYQFADDWPSRLRVMRNATMSRSFFNYLHDRTRWSSDKKGPGRG